ncbi:hypothetical protein PRCB_01265 [Pantoea rodasii]|uniref:Uncharacterized protein n=1 Tax=Pantoea rodasii TaxID=1076549 RepID=A0A2M9WIE5_9GAMM|nr:hypothetical protein [Pantoea rodasii]ORM64197.1 hypothetical protein HA45_10175 [Pantoea rodasii]PJZ07323.1 hypothetical protein PRCB_01265 [Pantoea rodasii]
MKFRLHDKDGKEVQAIADSLPDDELQNIAARVDSILDQRHMSPIVAPACIYLLRHFDHEAMGMFDMDDELEMAADAFMRDMMITAAKRERAIEIWKHKHSYDEVA